MTSRVAGTEVHITTFHCRSKRCRLVIDARRKVDIITLLSPFLREERSMVRKRKVNISTSREGSGRPDCVLLDAGEPEDFEGEEGIPGEGADTRHF